MIGFAGLSHLGIVSSAAAAAKGFQVAAYDRAPGLAGRLAQGELPVFEPELAETIAAAGSRLRYTSRARDLEACELVVISLDVPTDDGNRSEVAPLEALIDEVLEVLHPGAVLVILSQVPPGFMRRLAARRKDALERRGILLYGQVETLIFGRAVERALKPERFIVGASEPRAPLPPAYAEYLAAFGCPVLPMRYESAELAKISINVFLAASLSATNTLAELCERVGADWQEIVPALRLDARIGAHAYLAPGLGIGGGNIERDLVAVKSLAAEHGTEACVPSAFLEHSRVRRDWVLRELHRHVLSCQARPVVALWGLAYKPGTKSTKNSPSLALLDALGGVRTRAYDPQVSLDPRYAGAVQVASPLEACRGAHALVVMTALDEFSALSPVDVRGALARPVVIDPQGVFRTKELAREGFVYSTLGKAN
ncbi:MAG: UDP-glucose/GDP-mannose dehydrogenase family protein [Elusimicrobia bacterium]|nr:UDP-glucose/GDP-mannose dehydrogenase family protein [Elusimicrobiota bacterium]